MKKEKIFFLFLIIFTISVSLSFHPFKGYPERRSKKFQTHLKTKREKPIQKRIRHNRIKTIRSLNPGQPRQHQGPKYSPDQVLVKFKHSLPTGLIESTIAAYDSRGIKKIPRLNVYQIQIPEYTTVEEMIFALGQNPDVEYVEPNYRMHLAVTPNDPYFKWQYSLYNSGQEIWYGGPRGTSRADIKATEGWEETTGVDSVVIAVLDTGVDMDHPDLENNILSAGRDFANDDFDATDDHWHGTHVSGIAAANTNNEIGIAGVAWNCKILPVKVIKVIQGQTPFGETSWVAEGITWATDNGADIINLSIGVEDSSQTLENAMSYAYERDVVIVAAAGNESAPVLYPAAYNDYCLAVAATDHNDNTAVWSNFGPQIDIAAPGENILSLVPTWSVGPGQPPYAYSDGTSMSTPHVAGLAALIKGLKPWLENWEIMNVIRYSADDVNSVQHPGNDEHVGYGRINSENALVPINIRTHDKRLFDFK